MKKFRYTIIILIIIYLFLLNESSIEIKETPYKSEKNEKIYEEKLVNEDSTIIKNLLIKVLESQISETNFVSKHFINKTLDEVSRQLAIYYNQILNFKDDPERSIKMVNDIIDNSQAYIEAAIIFLEKMRNDLIKDYDEIKNKYCNSFFENFLDIHSWKEKASLNETEKMNDIELQLNEVDKILSVCNRIRMLFKIVDWTIYSKSPFAWLARKYIGW